MTHRAEQLFGKTLKTLSFRELILTETAYAPYAELPEHSHTFAYFCFVLNGSFAEKFGRQNRVCSASTLIFHPRSESHSDSFHAAGGRCFNLQLETSLLNRIEDYSIKLNDSILFREITLSNLAAKIYSEFCQPDDFSALSIEGLVLEMTAEISRQSLSKTDDKKPLWLKSVEEIIRDRFAETLTLNEIATLVRRHPVHLAREFRKHYRCTVGEYVRRLRIDFAVRELSKSNNSLSEIALNAGFSQQSHFTKTF